ncbi:MAG TPA: hypothetical protein VHQ46_01810, partial [Desulfobacteria bacterium]|nr:hypothetical protein [Desulfobacteria bacterium]
PFEDKLQAFRVSVSWGSVTTSCHNTASIDAFIDAADRKLYNMKRHKPNPPVLKIRKHTTRPL